MERELRERLKWFLSMRRLAALGILAGTFLASRLLIADLPTTPLYLIGIAILGYNVVFRLYRPRAEADPVRLRSFIYLQICLDWLALTLVVHFSGGAGSPVTVIFALHLIIGAILLSVRAGYLLATVASLLVGMLSLNETLAVFPPPVGIRVVLRGGEESLGTFIVWLGLTGFFFAVAYLTTSITLRLREKERALFESQQALDRSYHEMEALYRLGQVVNSSLDLDEVLGLIAESAAKLLDMKACFIRLLDRSGKNLYIGGTYGLSQAYINKGPVEVGRSSVDLEALRGGVVQVLDVGEDARFQYREEAKREGLLSMLCIPVQAKNRVLGVIRVYSGEPHLFSLEEQRLLRNLANLGAVAIENARSYSDLQKLNQEKVWFARMTHHQLRSPLAAIQGVIDALPFAGSLNEKQVELVERAKRRIGDAFSTIKDFLDLAAAQRLRDPAPPAPVELSKVLSDVLEAARDAASSKGLELTVKIPPRLMVAIEPADLDRVFSNLVGNAVKYTPAGGKVTVEAALVGNEIRVDVSDTGIGISPEDQGRIYEGFFRSKEARSSGEMGTGLGLSIVKTLLDRFGGRIELESRVGQGTRFRVWLPAPDLPADEGSTEEGRAVGTAVQ